VEGAMVCQEEGKVKWRRRTGRQSAGVTKMGEKKLLQMSKNLFFFALTKF